MRSLARLLFAAVVAAVPIGVAMMSCGTDAVGVDACRQIETARCNAAPTCVPDFDVTACSLFYRDECLVGIGNADAGDVTSLIAPCVAAIGACADASAEAGCPGQALVDASCIDDGGVVPPTPCNIILHCPEILAACNFVAMRDAGDAGDAADSSDAADAEGSDAGDGGDSGDAGVQ